MPTIAQFYGLLFIMHTRGEHPPPHVHVKYNEYEASIEIKTGKIMEGYLPPRSRKLALKWINANQRALLTEWERMELGETPKYIKK